MAEKPKEPCHVCGQVECQCRREEKPPLARQAPPPARPNGRPLLDTHAAARIAAERLLHERLLHEKRQRGEWEKLREFEMNYEPPDME